MAFGKHAPTAPSASFRRRKPAGTVRRLTWLGSGSGAVE
jgi:hypothetical protein